MMQTDQFGAKKANWHWHKNMLGYRDMCLQRIIAKYQ